MADKDWWVCVFLKAVFQSKYESSMIFKDGTSLSGLTNKMAVLVKHILNTLLFVIKLLDCPPIWNHEIHGFTRFLYIRIPPSLSDVNQFIAVNLLRL